MVGSSKSVEGLPQRLEQRHDGRSSRPRTHPARSLISIVQGSAMSIPSIFVGDVQRRRRRVRTRGHADRVQVRLALLAS
jgi:hypothetical protein